MYIEWAKPISNFSTSYRQPPEEIQEYPLFRRFEVTGRFWVPDQHEHSCWGILRFGPGSGLTLQLDDPPSSIFRMSGILLNVIFGKLGDGSCLTLFDCWGFVKTYMSGEEHQRAMIRARYMIGGRHLPSMHECLLIGFSCQFTHLNDWFSNPYHIEHSENYEESFIRFTPDEFQADLELEGVAFQIRVNCSRTIPFEISESIKDWKYNYNFRISPTKPQSLSWFLSIAATLRNCMIFLIGSAIYTLDLVAEFQAYSTVANAHLPATGPVFLLVDVPSVISFCCGRIFNK